MKIVDLIQQKYIMKWEVVDNYQTDWLEKHINDKDYCTERKTLGTIP